MKNLTVVIPISDYYSFQFCRWVPKLEKILTSFTTYKLFTIALFTVVNGSDGQASYHFVT